MELSKTFLILILLFSLNLKGQEDIKLIQNDFSKHSVNIELFGKSYYYASASYEYNIKQNFVIGSGIGFTTYQQGSKSKTYGGVLETGNYKELYLSVPIYAIYKIGKRKSHLLISAGSSFFTILYYDNFPSKKTFDYDIYIAPFVSLGYEYMPNKFFYRVNIYAEHMISNSV